ncbi:neuroglian isoform X3 [Microplitis mediator]|uniref:neuroglian isoform X3 n=1 Tax=Microplitis mediator TaxID=375433 RepID=UPI002554E0F7|nr:neuroglian isoform X3 [Microplitis mediator]
MKCSIFIILVSAFYASAIVSSPPRMIKQPPTDELLFQVAQQNENEKPFVIECEAEGEPGPVYTWIKNGKPFNYAAYDDRISVQPGRGSLVIAKPRDEDLGQYQCFAKNEFGTATSNSVFVRKAELNSFKEDEVQALTANEGDPFHLSCASPDGWPKPNIFWIIQDYQGAIKSINNSRMTLDPEGTLWFSNVTRNDVSEDFYYKCAASSQARNEFKLGNSFLLNVISGGSSNTLNKHEPVRQYVTRKNEIAFRGKKAKLYCIFGGTPLPEIIWSKDGERIKTSDRITHDDYGKSLVLKRVDFQDQGVYTCEASNGVGRAISYSINLQVKSAPYFTVEPEIENAAEDDTVTFRCEAHGVPEPDIKWIYNGKPIAEAPDNPRREITTNSITIRQLTKKDTGNYGCNATNAHGYVYKDVYVNVLALPAEITQPPADIVTVDGKDVIMSCRVFGAPKPAVKWIRNGQELTGGRFKTLDSGDLKITNVGFIDTGAYTCHASNKLGQDEKNATLAIKERTKITDKPEDYEVYAGASATFRCNAITDSTLELEIEWLRNNNSIDFEIEPRFVQTSDNSLTISKTTELDSGIYTCVAKTELDETRASATLTVQDVPNAPVLQGIQCYENEARINWVAMGDNRAPISHYIVEYNTSFTPDSWEVIRDDIPGTSQTYNPPMSPWANFTFRVIAVNKVGRSKASPHSQVCTTLPDVPYENPKNVMGNGTDPHNIVISWTVMPQILHNGPKFQYRVMWREDIPGKEWERKDISNWRINRYVIDNQPTYQRYQIKVVAINEVGESRAEPKVVIGYSGEDVPTQPPGNFTVEEVQSSTKALLSWSPVPPETVKGELRGYKIQTWTERDAEEGMREITIPGANTTSAVVDKFVPYTKNYVKILAFNGRYNGPPSEILNFNTPEGVPGTVLSLDAYPLGSSALFLKWTKPAESNGVLTGYRIYYQIVEGTSLGPLLERQPHVNNPEATSAKLATLKPETKYRVHIRATTRAGEGVDFYIDAETRNSQKPDVPQFQWQVIPKENGYVTIKLTWLRNLNGYPGSHFFAKYKLRGETIPLETEQEFLSDDLEIRGLLSSEVYVVSIVAVDGDYLTESEPQEIETSSEGPIIQPKENVATAGWFIGMMLAIVFLLMVLIIVCIIKRNRGGKYAVHERELAAGRGDYPEEGGFHEYSQPLDTKSAGGRTSLASSSHQDGKHPESDTDSMAEYGEGDTGRFTEDGSFIGQYGPKGRPDETPSIPTGSMATYV